MASNITLSAGVRQNLLSLQNTAALMSQTQSRLSTGKKVNSALDNPVNFFTSSSLQARATDLSALIDSMSNGIKQLQAADNGITSITSTVQSMQSTIRQARQDKSFKTESYAIDATTIGTSTIKNLSFSGGAVGTTPVNIGLNDTSAATSGSASLTFGGTAVVFGDATIDTMAFSVTVNGTAQNISIAQADAAAVGDGDGTIDDAAEYRSILTNKLTGVTVGGTGNTITITSNTTGTTSTVSIGTGTATDADTDSTGLTAANFGVGSANAGTAGTAAGTAAGTPKTVDQLVTAINNTAALKDKVVASSDNGKLRIQNLSTADLTITGVGADGEIDGTAGTATIGGNDVRKTLVTQFNTLLDQLNKTADDSSFNGINLLRADKLKLVFNEIGTSTLEIQAKDVSGNATSIDAAYLGITTATNADFGSDATLDSLNEVMTTALSSLRAQASAFGSNLSIVQNRQDFTKSMINTLQTGADNLVLADTNEEGANLLALQTRQQLSTTALSLSSQADQAVLRLF